MATKLGEKTYDTDTDITKDDENYEDKEVTENQSNAKDEDEIDPTNTSLLVQMTQKPLVLLQKVVEERAKNYDNDMKEWNGKHQGELKERENYDDISTNIKAEFKQPNITRRLNPRIFQI